MCIHIQQIRGLYSSLAACKIVVCSKEKRNEGYSNNFLNVGFTSTTSYDRATAEM
jgi:hypothetical protein